MAKLTIIKYGDSVLRKKTRNLLLEEINTNNSIIRTLAYNMIDTMQCAEGVGIAAPQVGISLSLCIIKTPQDLSQTLVMINPKITFKNNNKTCCQEGCLSLPGIYEDVNRFSEVICEYINLDCKHCIIEARGLLSRIIQHEVDHLNAKLFIDYLSQCKKLQINKIFKTRKQNGLL
ncbi:MAG: peptide deformylase [Endomicrobium sp.]|jgi:peptide deformylase|nr:peptide deformylase [Endomicrobium sp.]